MECCIYCGILNEKLTDEHVVSEGLGCKRVLPKCVCDPCNSVFGHSFEGKAINDLTFFRNLLRIPGKEGAIPSHRCTGTFDGQEVDVTFSGNGEVIIPSRSVGEIKEAKATGKQYVIFRRNEEHIIERNLRRKHSDLVWKRRPGDEGIATVEVRAEFDARVLCSLEMNRTVAKFWFNLIAEVFGLNAVTNRCNELRRFILTGQNDGAIPAGIIWNETTLRHVPSVPPKHLFILFRDGKKNRIVILISLFSLFPFCVVANDPEIRADAFNSRTIDPYVGRFVPLLASRPFPEAVLGRTLPELPRCGLKEAIAAATFAHKWVLDTADQMRSPDGKHVLCYECGRVFEPRAATCPYCEKDPLPSKAAAQEERKSVSAVEEPK